MPLQDEELARRAATGDHAAFAELYDRYERSAYNLCYRITGSAEDAADATQETFLKVLERLPGLRDRELNFAAYVMRAARNASYDAIERRKRATPTSELPEVASADDHEAPERAALRVAHQEQIRVANESLPARQREVLALRELEDLSYGEVAEIMGMNQNSVAQLISRARINLRDGLRHTALGSVASASPDCDRALPLLASRQDGLLEDAWLVEHLMSCGACRVRLEAMEEAAVAYRQWLLLVPALWLREETAKAAERVNAGATRPRVRGRVLAGAAATFVLALVIADAAQSPTSEPAPEPEAEAVERHVTAAAPKLVERRAKPAKKPRARARKAPKVIAPSEAPQVIAPSEAPQAVSVESQPVVTAKVVAAPEPSKARPRRQPQRAKRVVVADPPVEPDPADVITTTPVPPEPTPDGTTTTPPVPCQTTAVVAGCPPQRPPVVTCRKCGIVAPVAPPRAPLRVVDPNSVDNTP